MNKSVFEKNIYRLVNALLLLVCVLLCLGDYVGIDRVSWRIFPAACAVMVYMTAWCLLETKGRVVLAIVALEILFWQEAQQYIQMAMIALVCFVVTLLAEQLWVLRAMGAGVLLIVLLTDMFGGRNQSHLGVVCALLYVVMVYVEWVQRHWKKEKVSNNRHYMACILPFLVFYFGLTVLMPAPDEPYDWRFVKEAYAEVKEVFLQISRNWLKADREEFDFGTSGFSGEGRLFGGISDEQKILMSIQGQAGLKTNVYLMGKVYDTFDGKGWKACDESKTDERQLDALETIYAARLHDAEGFENYLGQTGISIRYEDFHTGYLFTPLKTFAVQAEDYSSVGGSYLWDEKRGYATAYQTIFVQMNVDHPVFYHFLEEEVVWDEEEFRKLQEIYCRNAKYSLNDLEKRRENIVDRYSQSEGVSKEVEALLAEITEDAETDMDKLKAIEAYLQQMTYTKNPGALPDDIDSEREFLDYFLLESRQGYCAYFASAFVLLARAEGVPARYVEGFCVPVDGAGQVYVYSDMAHGWPEVYVEKVGWIPFEPTPGYGEIRYTPWEMLPEKNVGEGDITGISITAEDMEDEDSQEFSAEEDAEKSQESEEDKTGTGTLFQMIGFTLVFVLIAGGMVLGGDYVLRKKRISKYSDEERFKAEVLWNLRILSALGYERMENETFSELRRRAWAIMDGEETEDEKELVFLKLYEEYLYGEYPVSREMLEVLASERDRLLVLLKRFKPMRYRIFYLYYHIF